MSNVICSTARHFSRYAVAILGVVAFGSAQNVSAQVSLTTLGVAQTQDFNGLPTTGTAVWANNSTIPGWFHARVGTGANVVANDGNSNGGNLYSYGTVSAADRALGSVGSSNAAIGNLFWGVRLQNNTGATITSFDVSYTGEQWRNSAAVAQSISFSYLVGTPTVTGTLAEFQSAGTAVPELNFTGPISGGTAGPLDGNAVANRTAITFSITGLSIPAGTEVMLRWFDPDHTGSDHGLSIDDFSVTPQGAGAASADISVTKTDSPDPVSAGNNISYTITVTNAGPDAADTASFSDTLPAGTTFVSLPAVAGWSCTTPVVGAGGTVDCSNPSFAVGSAVFTLTTAVGSSTAAGTMISNTATGTSTTADPNAGNESSTATTTVVTSADLSISKTDTPDPVSPGSNLTYTITASNAGPSDAASVDVSDTLPTGTTFVSLAAPGGWTCSTPAVGSAGTVACNAATFANAGSAVFTLTTAVDPGVATGTVISNTATVLSSTTDPNTGNESATATTTVGAGSADLSITKIATPEPVNAGASISYTITATNAGTSNASTATVIDTLPVGTTFVSLAAPGTWSCTTPAVGSNGVVNCANPSMPAGSDVFTLVVQVGASVVGGTVISNTATVASATTDPNPGNESATANTTVTAPSSISGTKTASGNFQSGGAVTYTITLNNSGVSAQGDNPGNEFTDVLPAGLSLLSATASAGTAVATLGTDTVTWNGAIAAGGSVVITINASIDANLGDGFVIINQGTISYDGDGNGTNESTASTDDPTTIASPDGTSITVAAAQTTAIPLSSTWMNLLLMAVLGLLAIGALRRNAV